MIPNSIAIHQPNFFPWVGYFHKIALAERFLLMDHVQVTMAQGWHSRVKMLSNGSGAWFTLPVDKSGKSGQSYRDILVQQKPQVHKKQLRMLDANYRKHPFFNDVMPYILAFYESADWSLSKRNMQFITSVAQALGLSTDFIVSSDMVEQNPELLEMKGNEHVLQLVKVSGASAYITGDGADDYLEPERFKESGIDLVYQNFVHPTYPQLNTKEFEPRLSIIDILMNVGFDEAGRLIKQAAS